MLHKFSNVFFSGKDERQLNRSNIQNHVLVLLYRDDCSDSLPGFGTLYNALKVFAVPKGRVVKPQCFNGL